MNIQDLTHTDTLNSADTLLQKQAQLDQKLIISFSNLTPTETNQLVTLFEHYFVTFAQDEQALSGLFTYQALSELIQNTSLFNDAAQHAMETILNQHRIVWQLPNQQIDLTTSGLVYAILNTTPDSFYDGGKYFQKGDAITQIETLVASGADVIEVGGQSTRPGYTEISSEEELERILPYIDILKSRFPDIFIAVDSYKPKVIEKSIDAGVHIINDINGFVDDPRKIELVKNSKVGLVSMLNRRLMNEPITYTKVIETFDDQLQIFKNANIDLNRVSLDPGIGFSTVGNLNNDLALMHGIKKLNQYQLPIMTAVSNKSYLQKLLGLAKDDRLTMTLITEALLYSAGNRILRVHNVAETVQMRTLIDTIHKSYLV